MPFPARKLKSVTARGPTRRYPPNALGLIPAGAPAWPRPACGRLPAGRVRAVGLTYQRIGTAVAVLTALKPAVALFLRWTRPAMTSPVAGDPLPVRSAGSTRPTTVLCSSCGAATNGPSCSHNTSDPGTRGSQAQ